MAEIKSTGRGGWRGIPKRPRSPEGRRITVTAMVAPSTRRRITELKERGVTLGVLIDEAVARVAAEHGIE